MCLVLVIEGVMGCSNLGGQSATIAKRNGFIGAIVAATVRHPGQYRHLDLPGLLHHTDVADQKRGADTGGSHTVAKHKHCVGLMLLHAS